MTSSPPLKQNDFEIADWNFAVMSPRSFSKFVDVRKWTKLLQHLYRQIGVRLAQGSAYFRRSDPLCLTKRVANFRKFPTRGLALSLSAVSAISEIPIELYWAVARDKKPSEANLYRAPTVECA